MRERPFDQAIVCGNIVKYWQILKANSIFENPDGLQRIDKSTADVKIESDVNSTGAASHHERRLRVHVATCNPPRYAECNQSMIL